MFWGQDVAMPAQFFNVDVEQAGITLAAVLRKCLPGRSWSEVRRLIEGRHIQLNRELCLDPARRVKAGDSVEVLPQPAKLPHQRQPIEIVHCDEHVVVVNKPSGLSTVRHRAERAFSAQRKELTPTLEDLVPGLIRGSKARLRVVHRLDKETSGLLVFARTVAAERGLGKQFHAHTVCRRYLAIVPGAPAPQRIASHLVRDRGDGRRGSTDLAVGGKDAITHIEVIEKLPGYTLLACRLETGRTHQIRIHLAELGHPVCGEKVYNRHPAGEPIPDESGAPRLALHATELGFVHPATGATLHWERPLPADLQAFLDRLRGR